MAKKTRDKPFDPPKAELYKPEPPSSMGEIPQTTTDPLTREIARINATSMAARATWLGLLAYLAFAGVTLLGVEDADFFDPSRQTKLPLVNVTIPTASFFWLAPLLGMVLYFYLHVQLTKLWAALADSDPTINKKKLSELIYPWIVSDLALRFRSDQAAQPYSLANISAVGTAFLIWLLGIIVILMFWVKSLSKHDEYLTTSISIYFGICLFIGIESFQELLRSTKYIDRKRIKKYLEKKDDIGIYNRLKLFILRRIQLLLSKSIILIQCSSAKTAGTIAMTLTIIGILKTEVIICTDCWVGTFAETNISEVNMVRNINENWDYSYKKQMFRKIWCSTKGIDLEYCGSTEKIHPGKGFLERWCEEYSDEIENNSDKIKKCDEFQREAERSFQNEWTNNWTNQIAALGSLDIREVDLREAEMRGVVLTGADLSKARLQRANLIAARLQGSQLSEAKMDYSMLISAQLAGADLGGTHLNDACMQNASMENAFMEKSSLKYANLSEAKLRGVNFRGAKLHGAMFQNVDLASIEFDETFEGVSVRGSDLRSVLFTQDVINRIFGDIATKIPSGLVRPDHWDTATLSPDEASDKEFELWLIARGWSRRQRPFLNPCDPRELSEAR